MRNPPFSRTPKFEFDVLKIDHALGEKSTTFEFICAADSGSGLGQCPTKFFLQIQAVATLFEKPSTR
jgi:hypothetical protein